VQLPWQNTRIGEQRPLHAGKHAPYKAEAERETEGESAIVRCCTVIRRLRCAPGSGATSGVRIAYLVDD
jgi:hypothetical protein